MRYGLIDEDNNVFNAVHLPKAPRACIHHDHRRERQTSSLVIWRPHHICVHRIWVPVYPASVLPHLADIFKHVIVSKEAYRDEVEPVIVYFILVPAGVLEVLC